MRALYGATQSRRSPWIPSDGWDPVFCPERPKHPADVVNLGYVLNVIEDPAERAASLREAWGLCRQVLVVAGLVRVSGQGQRSTEFGDGILTGRGTFQKCFQQGELKTFLDDVLAVDAVPAGLGLFYVFKDDGLRQQFLASRFRRAAAAPRQRLSERLFEQHSALLEPFIAAVADLGRLPDPEEFPEAGAVAEQFGSLRRTFALVRRVTGPADWETLRRRRTEDLLVYVALSRFGKRPAFAQLPRTLQRDLRVFFGAYTRACRSADALLFRAGQPDAVDAACRQASVGKLLPNALYVHRNALDSLDPLLRIYEGCARAYLGEVEGANVIKLHRFSGKVSYLVYPDFETDPHPALLRSVKLSLRTRELECYDYTHSENPPVLHRKETLLPADDPLHARFARLTRQEERHGLLADSATIGTRAGWRARLQQTGFTLRGHRLVRGAGGEMAR